MALAVADMGSAAPQVSQVYNFWKDFELEELRGKLDEQGLAIAEKQEASVNSRKKLAETTKEFKRTAGSEAVKQVGALLKSYQAEVDQVTARAKYGEAAFLDVYQKLYEAPDPAPALASALEMASHSAELEAQVRKLAQELAEYKAESKELKNQDGTIRRLEERVRGLEAQNQEKDRCLEEAAAAVEAAGSLGDGQEHAQREQALISALTDAQSSLSNLQRLHEASQKQLFSMQTRSEDEQASLQSELEIATAEMERAQQRLMSLEREKEALVAQVSSSGSASKPAASEVASRANEESLRAALGTQRELVSRLHSELSSVSLRAEEEASAWSSRCEGLRAALQAQEAHAEALERELATRPSAKQVEELRQQLRLLQAVGFGSLEAEEGQVENSGPGAMEALLLGKTRKLEHEVTMARLRLAEVSGQAEAASARIVELEADLQAKEGLIARLEEDLLATDSSGKEGSSEVAPGLQNGLPFFDTEVGAGDSGGERTMVSVLCSQRDRFRRRVSELEEDLAQAEKELKAVRRDLEGARADNVALVERLRYVQGYQARSRTCNDVEAGTIESKYASVYEERNNPFIDWKEREKASRKRQLNMADRIMFEFGQFISSSQ